MFRIHIALKCLWVGVLLIWSTFLRSQTLEIGLMGGIVAYQGDLTPAGLGILKQSHLTGGPILQINLNEWVAVQAILSFGTISGDDRQGSTTQKLRNLSFRSPLKEYGLRAYAYPLSIYLGNQLFKPFVGVGLARYHFNPQARFNDEWVDLRPLSTEGQGLVENRPEYTLAGLAVPISGGVKWLLTDQWALSAELVSHITFSDYLDDVSTTYPDYVLLQAQRGATAVALSDRSVELPNGQMKPTGTMRGNAKKNDWLVTAEIKISYNLSLSSKGKVKCPDFF